MANLNLKDFFESGAFLQTGPDQYKVLVGPFKPIKLAELQEAEGNPLLYKPNFWDFLKNQADVAQEIVYRAEAAFDINREDFIHLLQQQSECEPRLLWQAPFEAEFAEQFKWSQNCFADTQLEKTVPIISQLAPTKFTVQNKVWCLRNLLTVKNHGWSYGFFDKEQGWLGHTPEILVEWNSQSQEMKTMALAGTYPKGPHAHGEMLADKKILNEHNIVVADIRNKLKNLQPAQGQTAVLELRHMLHLKTDFLSCVQSVAEAFNAIKNLHPTSAMGIYPANQQKLVEFSGFDLQNRRNAFAAPFGIFSNEAVNCVVAIRNIIFDSSGVEIFSGCGVTKDSDYGLELLELQSKRDSVKKMLGLSVE